MAAFGNPNRWRMMTLMGQGEAVSVVGMMALTGRGYRAVHKDLTILWASGAVAVRWGADKRVGLYHIAKKYYPEPGVVDYGFCRLRFGVKEEEPVSPFAKD